MLPGAVDELTAGHLGPLEDAGELAVVGLEHVAQEEGRPFLRREPLEEPERDREVGGQQAPLLGVVGRGTLGSDSQSPGDLSRSREASLSRSIDSRVATAISQDSGLRRPSVSSSCHRRYVV